MEKITTIKVGEYTVIQTTNNHISIIKDNQMVFHCACTDKKTEEELKDMINLYLSHI